MKYDLPTRNRASARPPLIPAPPLAPTPPSHYGRCRSDLFWVGCNVGGIDRGKGMGGVVRGPRACPAACLLQGCMIL